MTFKVGDKVRIASDSVFLTDHHKGDNNPQDVTGTVVKVSMFGSLPITVKWPKQCLNVYDMYDLVRA